MPILCKTTNKRIMANQTWQEALNRLKSGNQHFIDDKLDGKLQNSSRRSALTSGQQPYAIILSCADSRVVPELAFDTGLGEIFVIRIAGNVASTSAVASIEYAVAHLDTNLIIVLGHESCGAVTAAVKGGDNGPNLNHLLHFIDPALESAAADSMDNIIKRNAILTSRALVEKSDIIESAVKAGNLKILPSYYNMESGRIDFGIV